MKSEIYVANVNTQAVAAGGAINLGTIIRRFGNNACCVPALNLSGGNVVVNQPGYYDVTANVTVEPTAEGPVTVAVYQDGVEVHGAVATNTAGIASAATSVCIPASIRLYCGTASSTISLVLVAGAGNVTNAALLVESAKA